MEATQLIEKFKKEIIESTGHAKAGEFLMLQIFLDINAKMLKWEPGATLGYVEQILGTAEIIGEFTDRQLDLINQKYMEFNEQAEVLEPLPLKNLAQNPGV